MGLLTKKQLQEYGFKSIGTNVFISDKASFYGIHKIEIGNHVRIDDFAVLSAGEGGIKIGNYIHIGIYSSLMGAGRIELKDFSNISSKVSIFSSNDDYSGNWMTNPMVPEEFTNVEHGPVTINKHAIIGCGSVILPNVDIGEGVSIGALSLVNKKCVDFGVYVGTPAKYIKNKSTNLLKHEKNINNGKHF